jgi:hypothetical protein
MKAKLMILAVLMTMFLSGCVGVPVDVDLQVYRSYGWHGGYNGYRYQQYPQYQGYPYPNYGQWRRW